MGDVIQLPLAQLVQACERLRALSEGAHSRDTREILTTLESMIDILKSKALTLSNVEFSSNTPETAALATMSDALVKDLIHRALHLVAEIERVIALGRNEPNT